MFKGQEQWLPSEERLHNYGKIHHFQWFKSTISMAIFNSYVSLPEGKSYENPMKILCFLYNFPFQPIPTKQK